MNEYLVSQLKKGRLDKGLKQSDVTKLTGVKNTTLSNYENGVTEPDIDTFMRLCKLYNLDYPAILAEAYGFKVPRMDFIVKPSEMEHIEKYRSLDPVGQTIVSTVLNLELERSDQFLKASGPARNPENQTHASSLLRRYWAYYGKIVAAEKTVRFSDIMAGTLEAAPNEINRNADFAIGISGDSMEPAFHDGDIVYVQKASQLDRGELGLFQREDGIYIKEAGEDGPPPHNDKYAPAKDDNIVICMGKILGKVEGEYTLTT